MNEVLIYFSYLYKGDNKRIYEALENYEQVDFVKVAQFMDELKNQGIEYMTVLDEDYPDHIINSLSTPLVIYYRGQRSLLNDPNLVAIASDVSSQSNLENIERIANLNHKQVFVTGNWNGIDAEMVNLLEKGGHKIIYVAANGLEKPYVSNKNIDFTKNILVSQYPPQVHVKFARLLERNYFIAQLARRLILLPFMKKSKILNLASMFLELGKDIYSYPSENPALHGNDFLISEGATKINNYQEINSKI